MATAISKAACRFTPEGFLPAGAGAAVRIGEGCRVGRRVGLDSAGGAVTAIGCSTAMAWVLVGVKVGAGAGCGDDVWLKVGMAVASRVGDAVKVGLGVTVGLRVGLGDGKAGTICTPGGVGVLVGDGVDVGVREG